MEDYTSEVTIDQFDTELEEEVSFEPAQGFGSESLPKKAKKKKLIEENHEVVIDPVPDPAPVISSPEVKRHHEEPRPLTPKKSVPQRRVKASIKSTMR